MATSRPFPGAIAFAGALSWSKSQIPLPYIDAKYPVLDRNYRTHIATPVIL